MRALLARLFFSIDVSIGIGSYVAVSWLFGEPFNWFLLLTSLFFSHFPDLDLIPFLALKWSRFHIRRDDAGGHWPYGHHPMLVIPLAAALGWIIGTLTSLPPWYTLLIAATATFLHFVHDSVPSVGLHWFSPFSWRSYTLENVWPQRVPDALVRSFYATMREDETRTSSADEITSRIGSEKSALPLFIATSSMALLHYLSS